MKPPKSERIEDALRVGDARPFLNGISGLSIRNGVLLYKQPKRCFPNHRQETASGAVQMSSVAISTLSCVGNEHENLEIFLFPTTGEH
jgi:hypothetical protein